MIELVCSRGHYFKDMGYDIQWVLGQSKISEPRYHPALRFFSFIEDIAKLDELTKINQLINKYMGMGLQLDQAYRLALSEVVEDAPV